MVFRSLTSASLLALLLAACGEPVAPQAPAAPVAPAAPKAAAAAAAPKPAEAIPAIDYAYSPVGKRDPFRSVLDELTRAPSDPAGGSGRPDCGLLCKWEIEQLRLVGIISGTANPMAMVEDPNGQGYIVRRGSFMGKRNGKVTQIRSGEIVVTEIYKDQMGKPHANPMSIKIASDEKVEVADDQNLLTPEVAE